MKIIRPTKQRLFYFAVQLIVGLTLLTLARQLYLHHPYYIGYLQENVRNTIANIYIILCAVWLIDNLRKLIFVNNLPVTSSSVIFVFLYRIWNRLSYGKNSEKLLDSKTKIVLLSLVVKIFFFPIMMNTAVSNFGILMTDLRVIREGIFDVNFDSVFRFLINLLFLLDTIIFGFCYAVEAKWLNNQIRSVEPTLLGWVAALSTYAPFNGITGTFLNIGQTGMGWWSGDPTLMRVAQVMVLLCHTAFVASSVSLGFKATNLTNRGIVSRGTYSVVRHPAYTAKLTAWFFEGLLYAINFGHWINWLCLAGIYALRAWTEERHLSQDPDYLAYKKKVKWRVFPGIF